ncbi:MAG: hypothetical protein MR277_06950 [Methanobrevibacter ruminantium]|uniref:hypothetical protein n=1 Tax=Methanobrevibacter ruminantium TaxID=83816 RepID=UPI002D7F4258|nr:hypothetical protein [Methanobrevibacter ruminantium]MCI5737727.1 hypothetical protein [Methanobrevibacter ruminantium]
MANCCYSIIWTNHYIISNVDFFDVKYCQVEVSSKIVADENVFAIIKAESLCNPYLFTNRT